MSPNVPVSIKARLSDDDLQAPWSACLRAGAFRAPPLAKFESIGERVRSFLGPVRESIVADEPFELERSPGGPWQQSAGLGGEDE